MDFLVVGPRDVGPRAERALPDVYPIEVPGQRPGLQRTAEEHPRAAGNLIFDLRTAVLLREHGLYDIVTADTDFLQFPFLRVFNPLLGKSG